MRANSLHGDKGNFATTQWSVVDRAGDSTSPEACAALGALFSTYWFPLYAYARCTGVAPEEAQDLTQAFFVQTVEKNVFQIADRRRGKFRWFVLAAFKHFLANQRRYAAAARRGGGHVLVSLDGMEAEERYRNEPVDDLSPDLCYDRNWALTVLATARAKMRTETSDADRFSALCQYLPGGSSPPHAETAASLGISVGALKVGIHRFKNRFADALRAEVARTVATEGEVDAELRHLIEALYRSGV